MKKLFIISVLSVFAACGVWAQQGPQAHAAAPRQEPALVAAAKAGDVNKVRRLLSQEFQKNVHKSWRYAVLAQTDAHGNNALHVARNAAVFDVLWAAAGSHREELLRQRNTAGETPFMSHITYGHAAIFMRYFPYTDTYRRLVQVRTDLRSQGANRVVAEIKRDALVKECSAGGQTMWQRADALQRAAGAGSRWGREMSTLRDYLGRVAPYLKK